MSYREMTKEQLILELEKLKEKKKKLSSLLSENNSLRVQLENKVEEQNKRIHNLQGIDNLAIWYLDSDLNTTVVNEKLCSLLGYTKDEIEGRPVTDFMFEEDILIPDTEKTGFEIAEDGTEVRRFKGKDDTEIHAIVSKSIQSDAEGNPESYCLILFDHDELLGISGLIEKNTGQQDFILKSLPAAIYSAPYDIETDTTNITGNIKDLTGYTVEEFLSDNKFWQNRLHKDDLDRVLNEFKNNSVNNEIIIEYRWLCADGKYKWFFDRSILMENGSQKEYLGVMIDITDRKLSEEAINSSERSYTGLFNSVSDAIYIHKDDGVFIDVNEGAVKMYGFPREVLIGMTPEMVAAPGKNNMELVMDMIKTVLLTGEPRQFEFWARRSNGEIFLKDVILNKGTYNGEEVIITTARDITERKMQEEKFREQNENLAKINREKDKFFSIIAHDLRSPFNGFLGLTEIMADRLMLMSVNEIQKHATIMKGSAVNLYRLLDNLLEWSRMQKGDTVYKPEVFALTKVINECVKTSLDQAKYKDIEFEMNIAGSLFVYADIHMVETICRNLSSNAVKYTPRGGKVVLSTHLLEGNYVEISISDTGIGMSQEIIDSLFRIDTSVKRSGTEGEPSSGLGLLLCKEFVEKNKGRLWVESKEKEGSTFSFTLPLFFNKKIENDTLNLMESNSSFHKS